MPGFNQTGPMGQGPMTGRRMGKCTNYGAVNKDPVTDYTENQSDLIAGNMAGQGFGYRRGGTRSPGAGRQKRFRNRNWNP